MITRRNILKTAACTVLGGSGVLGSAGIRKTSVLASSADVSGSGAQRPNIVLIIADDIGYGDFGCFGHPTVRTPNIDGMAAQGVKFSNAFVTASSCSPSRCSLITGRYPHNTGAPELHTPLPENQIPFPKLLKDAGYYTALAGKGHMGNYALTAFDRTLLWNAKNKDTPSGCEEWISTLRGRDREKPFFFWLASIDAHRGWDNQETIGAPYTPDQAVVPPYLSDDVETRKDLANYYNEITRFDHYIGLVREELKRQNVLDNTAIIILSDNGRPFPKCKTRVCDSGVRTPIIVQWPAGLKQKGLEVGGLVSSIDVAPTILELAGVAIPPTIQGRSFVRMLSDPACKIRDYVFAEHNWHCYKAHERQVRTERYMYIRNAFPNLPNQGPPDVVTAPCFQSLLQLRESRKLNAAQTDVFVSPRAAEELYDVVSDPDQCYNLAADPRHQKTLKELQSVMNRWQSETGDTVPSELSEDQYDRLTGKKFENWKRGVLPGAEANASSLNAPGPINI